MKVTQKTLGLSVIALAGALFASATLADNMDGHMEGRGPMGPMGAGMGLSAADTDKDGAISKAEFEAWRAGRVTSVDTDKDGLISADELVASRMKQAEEMARTMADRMIAAHDGNADGKLSAEELMSMPTPGFDKLDANGDGTISAEELAQMRGPRGGDGEGRGHGRHHRMPMPEAPAEAPQDGN